MGPLFSSNVWLKSNVVVSFARPCCCLVLIVIIVYSCSWLLTALLPRLRLEINHSVHFLGRVAQQALQVANEPVDVPFAGRLEDDVLVVVVAEAARQLLVVHLRSSDGTN